jgi:hypothetical protein
MVVCITVLGSEAGNKRYLIGFLISYSILLGSFSVSGSHKQAHSITEGGGVGILATLFF